MPKLGRNGVQIHYTDEGEGPPVLLTCGYSATAEMWRPQVRGLRSAYRLLTWDLRGHGESDSPEDLDAYAEEKVIDDMAAILDACGVARAVIGGLSLGGYLSLAFWLKHAERVRALMLFDTGPGYRNPEGRARWNQGAEAMAQRFEREGLAALGGGAEVRVSTHRSAEGLARAARGTLKQFDARVIDALPSISVPVLVLVGENDEPFLGATDYMAAKIPGAAKVVIPGAGHAPNLEKPKAFNAAVRSFLDGLPAD